MKVIVKGHHLPGLTCGPHEQVHVGLQVGTEPQSLVPGDASEALWTTEIHRIDVDVGPDFRGPAVHGRPCERFLYLTWGEVHEGRFDMFRRAKLMLAHLAPLARHEVVVGRVALTDAAGMPLCARVEPPTITWNAPGR